MQTAFAPASEPRQHRGDRHSRGLAAAVAAAALCLGAACSATKAVVSALDAAPDTTQATVGPGGASLSTPDGVLALTIPAGALTEAVTVTLAPTTPPLPGAVGAAFEIGPAGTKLASPARVVIRYVTAELEAGSPDALVVATVVDGRWQPLAETSVQTATFTVSGETSHFSPYALVYADTLVTPEAGTCSSDDSMTGSCAAPPEPLCSDSPGAVLYACSDQPGGGYSATCCPPQDAGAAIDGAFSGDEGESDGPAVSEVSTDTEGASPSSCTADTSSAGTCARPSIPLCSDLPGTLPASCANDPSGDGYTAMCCRPDAGEAG
jgi:hypothetical protein